MSMRIFRFLSAMLALTVVLGLLAPSIFAQETTGGLQGTVKDPVSYTHLGANQDRR